MSRQENHKEAFTIKMTDRIIIGGREGTVNWARTQDGITKIWMNFGEFEVAAITKITTFN